MKYSIINSANNTYIQCLSEGVDEDGVVSTKRGFIKLSEASKAPALLAKLQKGERTATFTGRPNNGLYEVVVGHAVASEEAPVAANEIVTAQ